MWGKTLNALVKPLSNGCKVSPHRCFISWDSPLDQSNAITQKWRASDSLDELAQQSFYIFSNIVSDTHWTTVTHKISPENFKTFFNRLFLKIFAISFLRNQFNASITFQKLFHAQCSSNSCFNSNEEGEITFPYSYLTNKIFTLSWCRAACVRFS